MCFSPNSSANVTARLNPEIKRVCPTTPFLIVGLKTDLRDDKKTVKYL